MRNKNQFMIDFTVSVCIPTYNQAQYLRETLISLLIQDRMPDQIWICDDCSTDDTEEVVGGYLNKFKNIYYIKNKRNMGLSQNIYQLLRRPSTDYIVMLHSDDALYPKYIKTLSKLLTDHKEAGVAHCNIQEIDEYSRPTRKRILNRSYVYQNAETALKASVKGYRVAANVIMFRKASLDTIELPTDWPDFVEDYNIFTRLAAANWGNVFSSEILACYRVWIDQKGVRVHRKEAELKGYIRLFEDVLEPAFQARSWNTKVLQRRRRQLALLHSVYLTEVKLELDAKSRVIELLRKLGDSRGLTNRINLHTSRFSFLGKSLLFKYTMGIKIRNILKKGYLILMAKR